jgi:hypothetical protein
MTAIDAGIPQMVVRSDGDPGGLIMGDAVQNRGLGISTTPGEVTPGQLETPAHRRHVQAGDGRGRGGGGRPADPDDHCSAAGRSRRVIPAVADLLRRVSTRTSGARGYKQASRPPWAMCITIM